jgi:hypothetical protein
MAERAFERALTGMFSKVVSQVARLFEDAPTVVIHALKVQFNPLSLRISFFYRLMPRTRNSIKSLRNFLSFACILLGAF